MNKSRPHIANRMQHIEPFYVMDLLARARALEASGRSVIHMEIGEPDFITPDPIIQAGKAALDAGHTHYTNAMGLPALREAISTYYKEHYKVDVPIERIVITPGASGALQLAFGVLIDPGDQILMTDPGYPCNRHFVRLFEGDPVLIPVNHTTDYQLTIEQIETHWTPRTRGILVASPANPTGALVKHKNLEKLHAMGQSRGGHLIVDEIYHGLVYDNEPTTALSVSDDIFVINSFSKYFGMTGWRIGWMVVPEAYVRSVDVLAQNIFLAASTPAQYAALAAFEEDTLAILDQRRHEFQARRNFLLPELRETGFDIPVTPEGAFYLYADSSRIADDSFALANDLLEKVGVAVTPGKDFGNNAPEKHIRFAYTTSMNNLEEGVRRIREYIG